MGLFGRFKAPKASISVIFETPAFSRMGPLEGKLSVSSSEAFDADELRIEIWVTEWTKATQQKKSGEQTIPVEAEQTTVLHRGKNAVAGRIQITEGFNQDFPFSIPLPAGVPPTYRSQNVRNTWMLKGVIAVKGRPDVTSHDMEVQIGL